MALLPTGLVSALPPEDVDVPNASFETPMAPQVSPFARPAFVAPDDDDWIQTPVPIWWTFGAEAWDQSAGVFYNAPGDFHIVNADGEQLVFLFGTPDLGITQDLAATYRIGRSYELTVALRGGSGGMPLDSPIELSLYYRDARDAIIPIATIEFLNEHSGSPTSLLDVTVELPTVQSDDPWACLPIGIRILATVGVEQKELQGGTWGIDDVRLQALAGSDIAGDLNGDAVVDLQDYFGFYQCMMGPAVAPDCCYDLADVDGDADVDLADFSVLSAAFSPR